ncbi:MAG: MXAN_6640 family putative metalloprotease [candidate division KSB1 bacterium]|nr:MXAN_6640 family putative metalloprotease [candidate division KSB1 bacterium]
MIIRVHILFFILFLVFQAHGETLTVQQALQNAYDTGELTRAEYVAYQLQALRGPERLPEEWRGYPAQVSRKGTLLAAEAKRLLDHAHGHEQQVLQKALSRPANLDQSIQSPSGRFRIHYTLSGPDSSDPDFIRKIAATFDQMYHFEVDTLGFNPPPPDQGVDGNEWDVYVHNIYDYGWTTAEYEVLSTDKPYDYTGFIEMDNDFSHTFTTGDEAMRVTVAHELFHLIQMGYRSYQTTQLDPVWLFESCSVWMEDMAYDSVNDYFQYLSYYFLHLHNSLHISNGLREYGLGLFHFMLTKKYGRSIIRDIWEAFETREAIEAVDHVLQNYGSSLTQEVVDHAIWNFYTGERADSVRFYSEGAHYPELESVNDLILDENMLIDEQLALYAAAYFKVGLATLGRVTISPAFEAAENWMYISFLPQFNHSFDYYVSPGQDPHMITASVLTDFWIAAVNIEQPTTDQTYLKRPYSLEMDMSNQQKLESSIVSLFPNPYKIDDHIQGIQCCIRLTQESDNCIVSIYSSSGRLVRRQELGYRPAGDFVYVWDGQDDAGKSVSSGIYILGLNVNSIKPQKIAIVR